MKLCNYIRGVGQTNLEESVLKEKSDKIISFCIVKLPDWADKDLNKVEKERIQTIIIIKIKEKGR